MVLIHIKRGDTDGFLYEFTSDTSNEVVVKDCVCIWNLRIILMQLCGAIRTMARYGPMKHPDKAGLDEIDEKYNNSTIDKGQYYEADPTGLRTGNGVGPQLTETIERVCADTEAVLDANLVKRRIPVTKAQLYEKLDNIRGVVTMAYPMGLPDYDSIRCVIESNPTPSSTSEPIAGSNNSITGGGLEGSAASQEILEEDTAELWIASRCLDRREQFCARYGRNEKTKMIGKLQKLGGGAPGREAAVSEEERKAMMAFYFKKQEEMKQIAENNEDDYLNSSWANPKALQQSLRGQTSIRAPGVSK